MVGSISLWQILRWFIAVEKKSGVSRPTARVGISLAVSMAFGVATLTGCASGSGGPATSAAGAPFEQTKLFGWLDAATASQALITNTVDVSPTSRFGVFISNGQAPSQLLAANLTNIDPQSTRLAGIRTAELLVASLTSDQLREFSRTCFSRDRGVSAFGCPWHYLSFNQQHVVAADNFDVERARGAFTASLTTALYALTLGGGLERLIPSVPASRSGDPRSIDFGKWRTGDFRTAAVFPNEEFGQSASQVAFSGDGSRLVVAYSGPIDVRTLATGAVKRFSTAGERYVTSGLSPDGSLVVGVSEGAVTVWNVDSSGLIFTKSFPSRTNVTSRVSGGEMSAAWSPDGKWLITEAGLDTIVWNTATWAPLRSHPPANEAAWSPDSQRYVLIGMDRRPISETTYEQESKTQNAQQPVFQTEVFSVTSGASEARIEGAYRGGRWGKDVPDYDRSVRDKETILLHSTSGPEFAALVWQPFDNAAKPLSLDQIDIFSADGSVAVIRGFVTDIRSGTEKATLIAPDCCTDVDWSTDGRLLAVVTREALFIVTDD